MNSREDLIRAIQAFLAEHSGEERFTAVVPHLEQAKEGLVSKESSGQIPTRMGRPAFPTFNRTEKAYAAAKKQATLRIEIDV